MACKIEFVETKNNQEILLIKINDKCYEFNNEYIHRVLNYEFDVIRIVDIIRFNINNNIITVDKVSDDKYVLYLYYKEVFTDEYLQIKFIVEKD
jgi:hypothetical protein